MTKPHDYVVRADASIENVDLDDEVVTVKGRRLTEAGAERLARATLAEARRRNLIPGRKSLTAGSIHSPRVQFRVPEAAATQAQDRARARRRPSGPVWCRETRSVFRGCSGLGVGLGGGAGGVADGR